MFSCGLQPSRRAALGLLAGAAALVAQPEPSQAAYGEAANVFGKASNVSGARPTALASHAHYQLSFRTTIPVGLRSGYTQLELPVPCCFVKWPGMEYAMYRFVQCMRLVWARPICRVVCSLWTGS